MNPATHNRSILNHGMIKDKGGFVIMLNSWIAIITLTQQLSTETLILLGVLVHQLTLIPFPYVYT